MKTFWTLKAAAVCLLFAPPFVAVSHAQNFPSKPIHLIVGYAPGGAVDIVSRIIGPKLSERLGQQVLVENRAGGGSLIAINALTKAEADGHTVMMADIALSAAPALNKTLPYDAFKDLVPVVHVTNLPGVMAVGQDDPSIKSAADFVTLAKSRPGKLLYASAGIGSLGHLGAELFKAETGTDIVHVPYQSGAQVSQALLQGSAQMVFTTAPPILAFGDKVRILAISNDKRLPILPDVPTFAESGLPNVKVALWMGAFVTSGTDPKIISKLNTEINAVLEMPDIKEAIAKLGGTVVGGSPEAFAGFFKSDVEKWSKLLPESLRK